MTTVDGTKRAVRATRQRAAVSAMLNATSMSPVATRWMFSPDAPVASARAS